MTGRSKLGRQTLHATFSSLMDVLTVIVMIMAARFLGASDFGMLSFAQSLALILVPLGSSGLALIATRDVASDPTRAERYFAVVAPWSAFLSVLAFGVMIGGVALVYADNERLIAVVALIGVATGVRAMVMLVRHFLKGLQRFDAEMTAVALENLVMLPLCVALLFAGFGVIEVAAGFVIGRFFGLFFQLRALGRDIPLGARFDRDELAPIAKAAAPVGASYAVFVAVAQIDAIILAFFVTFVEVGHYGAAFKVFWGAMLIPAIATTILVPRLAMSMTQAKSTHNGFFLMGVAALALVAFLAAAIGLPLSSFTIWLLFGDAYAPASAILQVLILAMGPAFLVVFLRSYLVVIDHKNAVLGFSLLGLACRVALNLALIPHFGALGAAIATALSELIVLLAITIYLFRTHFKVRGRDFRDRVQEAVAAGVGAWR